jgi:hypothetical protein
MRKVINTVLLAALSIALGIMLGLGGDGISLVSSAFANAETVASQGRLPAKGEDAYFIRWKTIFAVGNTVGECNPNGMTSVLSVVFTNTGDAVTDMWVQDAETATGSFVNVTTSAITLTPSNSETYRWSGDIHGGPCWRVRSADTDLGAADGVGVKIKLHNRR